MNKLLATLLGLAAILVLFVSVNVVAGAALQGARVDLTENELYTLDEGTRNILRDLETPIVLRFYYSESLEDEMAERNVRVTAYAERVRELLEEYSARGGDLVDLRVLDPEPFSEIEDRAVAAGLQGVPVNAAGEPFYFGLVASNDVGDEEVIPFFVLSRDTFLEYDLTRAIYTLDHPERAKVGLISSLPLQGSQASMFQPQAQQPWFVLESLRQLFDVEVIAESATELPADVDVLVLVHPRNLSPALQFEIDQFVLGGGNLVAFIDPHSEVQQVQRDPNNPLSAATADRSSKLGPLLAAWGVEMPADKLAADRVIARRGPHPQTGAAIEYVHYLEPGQDELSDEDPITADLESLLMPSAGSLRAAAGATTTLLPLVQTSDEAMLIERMSIAFGPDPERLLESYVPGGVPLTVAARITGPARTAFPDGRPAAEEEDEAAEEPAETFLTESDGPVNLVLVSDADMLIDEAWVRLAQLGRQRIAMPVNDNADLLINAVDNLAGNADLISLRSRGQSQRPFDRIAELRREAEERYRAEEQRLEAKLEETEQAIAELQTSQEGGVTTVLLTPEQRQKIEDFREEQQETRKKLREVRHQLAKDIDDLTATLKFVNVLGVPALVALAGIAVLLYRYLRRS